MHEAWATKTVTYHVITLPFGSADLTGGDDAAHKYRIEALKKTVTCDDNAVIELPAEFKSPLLKPDAYSYYYTGNGGITITTDVQIFPNSNPSIKYNTYTIDDPSKAITSLDGIGSSGDKIDIYVTYEWNEGTKSDYGKFYKINGEELYNIEFVYKTGNTEKHEFFAMNMNTERGNRAQGIPFEYIKSPFDLSTDGPHKLIDGKSDETKTDFHYTWLLVNNDPYNIILETAYAHDKNPEDWGDFTYKENNIPKKSRHARFYGRVNSDTSVESNSWMNNEWGYGWYTGSGETPDRTAMPGWFRGTNQTGINTNGVQDKGLYFSFALLNRTNVENDLTLLAVCANTNATTWVPNGNGNYLHLGRQTGKYPGPYYSTFETADKIILHKIKRYTYKVKTPFGNVLESSFLMSEHYDPYLLMDFIPDALKRKYVKFEGAYKEGSFTNAITTFANATDNDGVVWLKYSTEMPFEAATSSTTFDELKWYNLNVNKEESYYTYYDEANNHFNTKSNPSIYNHNSHFAFVGDPYELYIVNRQACESDNKNLHYLNFAATPTDPLVISTYSTYTAVPDGTTLTEGKTYFTSNTGAGKFTAVGTEVSNGTNYFELEVGDRWEIVYDDNTGVFEDCFQLRKFNSYSDPESDPKYIGWMYGSTTYDKYPLNGSTTAAKLFTKELPLMYYTYYIVDRSGHIAVKAIKEQQVGITLGHETIPDVIYSPFLQGATLTFYNFNSKADLDAKNLEHKTQIYTTNSDKDNEYKNHILVYYDNLQSTYTDSIDGSANAEYNVILNKNYIYYDNGTINNKGNIDDKVTDGNYLWVLGGSDPYAMTIKIKGLNKFVEVADANSDGVPDWNPGTLSWSGSAPASKFIIKSSGESGGYEVMAATGTEVDASDTYYNIGRIGSDVKLYSNTGTPPVEHKNSEIRFQLKKSSARTIIYHLIDKSNVHLIQEAGRQAIEEKPQIPAEIFSPLVEEYTYWKADPRENDDVGNKYGEKRFNQVITVDDWNNPANTIDVWITYTTSKKVDLNHTTMYLLKFTQGVPFKQENGSDGMLTDAELLDENKSKPVYPYCNGDCNFNIYGQYQYELQQEGAASTRTRWAWYLESGNDDPYHVRILSRQTETYQGLERSAYFATREFAGYDGVVTSLVWPNISGVQSTEYMVLGNTGQYQLVTTPQDLNDNNDATDEGEDIRNVVNSFEQYWKTYDTVKKKLLSDLLPTCYPKDQGDDPSGSIEVPTEPATLRARLIGKGDGQYGFHSYTKMAYAKRWNGYNAAGAKSKGWEAREHWFQTVDMGSGYFDLIPITIDPALILLDQHGWEIMRKPMPSDPNESVTDRNKKLAVLRSYDSPMVKEYIFWASAKKRSGYHQYYLMDKRIGGDYTSTSLASFPSGDLENVRDNKGNLYDQYVTYIVKDEYALSYTPNGQVADPFLIRQGDKIAYRNGNDDAIGKKDLTEAPYNYTMPGGVSQYIIDNISSLNDELWYVKPNPDIDKEMGYPDTHPDWKDNPNAYEDAAYKYNQVAQFITGASDDATVKKYGRFTFSNGFDPYNIQISSKTASNRYFTLPLTSAKIEEGSMVGSYSGEPPYMGVKLGDKNTTPVEGTGYDNSKWKMTNQTLIAIQDANGNMQLMPRFDYNTRVRDFGVLVTPTEEAADANKLKETYTELYRPYVYNYRIIDNTGHESLRYQSGGELVPQTPDHLKSPLAKDFKYYHDLTETAGVYSLSGIDNKEITSSMVGAGLSTPSVTTSNFVYVRYAYDKDADKQGILLGKWLTMKLNNKDAIYSSGIKESSDSKPSPVDGSNDNNRLWQWKFLKKTYSDPDPYAVQVFNRIGDNKDKPLSVNAASPLAGGAVSTISDGTDGYYQHFALLSHSDTNGDGEPDTYALAVAGTKQDSFYFINGNGMTTSTAAVINEDKADYSNPDVKSGFNSTSGIFHATDTRVQLFEDVTDNYTYKVYTNDRSTCAISVEQSFSEAQDLDNDFAPTLPEEARSPLLNLDQYRYYETSDDMDVEGRELNNLYGLYDGDVYVRYTYDASKSKYKVPNEMKIDDGGHVAEGEHSNPSPLRFGDKMLYNIVWYDKDMMKSNDTAIDKDDTKTSLEYADNAFEWQFMGDDPYAIQIKNVKTGTYLHEATSDATTDLDASATTFMLLNRTDDFKYGMLAKTGAVGTKLTGYGNTLTTASGDPNKFVIFALSTLTVIYHLVIANIDESEVIPLRATSESTDPAYDWNDKDRGYEGTWDGTDPNQRRAIDGTSLRDLTSSTGLSESVPGDKYQLGSTVKPYPSMWDSTKKDWITGYKNYCYNFGPISLGDNLTVPKEFYRPNVVYTFVVDHITGGTTEEETALNNKYKGMVITSKEMGVDVALIGKTIYINIVYTFDGNLDSNRGDGFVKSVSENKWYTIETMVNNEPWLAQYTNAWGFELKEGRGSHYTNDFLWTPVGDAYGFRLFNRYMDVNSGDDNRGEEDRVIFSRHFSNTESDTWGEDIHDGGQQILMGNYVKADKLVVVGRATSIMDYPYSTVADYSIYELLEPTDPEDESLQGYFRFHPVANTKEQTQVYFNPVWADDDGDDTEHHANNFLVRLSPTATNFTFGLSKELLQPYFDRAGYVGGLKKSVYESPENAALVAAMKDGGVPTAAQLRDAQTLVYNFENTVPFATGYYRLHSPLGISGIDPVRYVSGYTHKTELTGDGELTHSAIPMHFYEENSERIRTFTDLKTGFIPSHATRGDLQILPVERDPASIFYFEKIYDQDRYNLSYIGTQGLFVKGEKGPVAIDTSTTPHSVDNADPNLEDDGKRPAALMTTEKAEATQLFVMDLGGGVLLIHDNVTDLGRRYLKYLSYDYSNDTPDNSTIYDMKLTNHTHTDHAKFCMQPVQDTDTKGVNEMPLKVNLNKGGDGYYYASFCAPYDVLLTDDEKDAAYICRVWDTEILHLKKVGKYNTEANGCPEDYRGSNQFVPAGTPVIIRSTNTSISMALPTTEPSTTLANNYKKSLAEDGVGNLFTGTYLEQLLAEETDESESDVYTFGLPLKGTATKHEYYASTSTGNSHNGEITFEYPQPEEKGIGFFINANPNREKGASMGEWIRNNRYVYNNRIYYRVGVIPGYVAAPQQNHAPEFIPVVFDDDDEEQDEELKPDGTREVIGDGCVYDLMGRKVATREQVEDGSWKQRVATGIYIINGIKIRR